MIKEENIERLSDEQRKEIEDRNGRTGLFRESLVDKWSELQMVEKGISINGSMKTHEWSHFHEWQAPPTDSMEKSCEIYKVGDILKFYMENYNHKRNGRTYKVIKVYNATKRLTYKLIGIQDSLTITTDGYNYIKQRPTKSISEAIGNPVLVEPTESVEKSCKTCIFVETGRLTKCLNECKFLSKWSDGTDDLGELIALSKELKAPPTDSVDKSCELFKIGDILEFNLKGKPHKRNRKLYRVKQVHNPKTPQHKHTYELIGIHDGLSVDTDGVHYTLKLCCVDCSRIKLAEKYPHQSNLICQSCNGYDMYEKIKPKPLPTTPRPMTALEIAQFIAKTGYMLCATNGLNTEYYTFITDREDADLSIYRYLKPNDDNLYEFGEV